MNYFISYDETEKNIPATNFPYPSDKEFNVIWTQIVEGEFYPDTYFEYIKSWSTLRRTIIQFNNEISNILIRKFQFNQDLVPDSIKELLENLLTQLKNTPLIDIDRWERIGINFSDRIKEKLQNNEKMNSYISSYRNFLFQYYGINSKQNIRLGFHNFQDAEANLFQMHNFFELVYSEKPDYFNDYLIVQDEIQSFHNFRLLLGYQINNHGQKKSVLKYLEQKEKAERKEIIQEIKGLLKSVNESGIQVFYPKDLIIEFPFKSIIIAYSVNDPCHTELELLEIFKKMSDYSKIQYVYLIPLYHKGIFTEFGFKVYIANVPKILPLLIENNREFWKYMLSFKITNYYKKFVTINNEYTIPEYEIYSQLFQFCNEFQIFSEINKIILLKPDETDENLVKLENRFNIMKIKAREKIIQLIQKNIDLLKEYQLKYPNNGYSNELITFYQLNLEKIKSNQMIDDFENIDYIRLFSYVDSMPINIE
ncbi:hypothetical protein [Methanospirillum stamsii]|uniref:Uncharacterized protein n=1 Tax=Methanospirillum stamsii TaxID=1277351 RepID=A0A2V2MXU5_9EURY|nr:hypothetical protein [Methanospirillum stamsii]PWR71105.1 hypothetical protein DLD82_14520 [Methanospirillum stamsii]